MTPVLRTAAACTATPVPRRSRTAASGWSPDDRTIAFTGTRPDTPQIYTIGLDGGEARKLTAGEKGASASRWSHDGTRILYSATFGSSA